MLWRFWALKRRTKRGLSLQYIRLVESNLVLLNYWAYRLQYNQLKSCMVLEVSKKRIIKTLFCGTPFVWDFKSGEQIWQYQDVAAKSELTSGTFRFY
jgi:hypothetical protein